MKNGNLVVDDQQRGNKWTFENISMSLRRPSAGGVALIGHDGPTKNHQRFAFDNEAPRHQVLLRPFRIVASTISGVGRSGSSTEAAPTAIGKVIELPSP